MISASLPSAPAKLFEAVTGYSYVVGLVVFGLVVVVYTAVGGFRGVAVTDALCAIAMLVGMFILLVGILQAGGGYEAIMEQITVRRPELLEPLSGGNMPYTLYISQWMLVGIFTVGLPQSVVRCITYKDTKSLHRAIIIGTVVIGAILRYLLLPTDFPDSSLLPLQIQTGSDSDSGTIRMLPLILFSGFLSRNLRSMPTTS